MQIQIHQNQFLTMLIQGDLIVLPSHFFHKLMDEVITEEQSEDDFMAIRSFIIDSSATRLLTIRKSMSSSLSSVQPQHSQL